MGLDVDIWKHKEMQIVASCDTRRCDTYNGTCMLQKTDIMTEYNISFSCAGQAVSVCVIVDPAESIRLFFFCLTQWAINRSPISLLPVSHAPRAAPVPSTHSPRKFFCPLYFISAFTSLIIPTFSFPALVSLSVILTPISNPPSLPAVLKSVTDFFHFSTCLIFSVPFYELILSFFPLYPLAITSRKTKQCLLFRAIPRRV